MLARTSASASQIVDNGRRNVGIPQAVTAGFRVAPQSTAGQRSDSSHEARMANHKRYVFFFPVTIESGASKNADLGSWMRRLNQFKSRLKEAKR